VRVSQPDSKTFACKLYVLIRSFDHPDIILTYFYHRLRTLIWHYYNIICLVIEIMKEIENRASVYGLRNEEYHGY